jgi:hypothetical protein
MKFIETYLIDNKLIHYFRKKVMVIEKNFSFNFSCFSYWLQR